MPLAPNPPRQCVTGIGVADLSIVRGVASTRWAR